MTDVTLIASLSPMADGRYLTSLASAAAPCRLPAQAICATLADARDWVLGEARALRAPVAWTPDKVAAQIAALDRLLEPALRLGVAAEQG